MKNILPGLRVLSAIVLSSAMLLSQIVTASLEGIVHDPSGAVVPDAKVRITNTSTNVATRLTTDASGRFVAPSLPPGGPYTVEVEAPGFKREERTGITLEINQSAKIDLKLQVGASTETVEVAAEAPLLEATTADQGAVISNREVVNLPLNARNPYALVFLSPGVTGTSGTQFNSANFSVNGGRPGSTDILVDGIPSSPPLVNPIQGISAFPSIDAVQEFKVETNAYSAEFGRTGSGIINLIYKSGTNQVHGSAYEFLRNSDLDANTFFANRNGTPLGSFKRSQFGGTVGGPIAIPKLYNGKDKTFFFVGYEGLRQSTAANFTTTVPTAAERTGDFSQLTNGGKPVIIYDPSTTVASGSGFVRSPFPNNMVPANQINPVAANIAKYYPLPNIGGPSALVNNFFNPGSAVNNSDQVDSKFDENINDRNRFFFRYSWKKFSAPAIQVFPTALQVAQGAASPSVPAGTTGGAGNDLLQQFNSAAFDYTFSKSPTFLMDFRYGLARTGIAQNTVSEGFDPTSLGFPSYIAKNADHLLFPGIVVSNYVSLGNAGQGQFKRTGFESHLATMNNTKVLTNHVLKFGGEFRLLRVNDLESGSSTGNFTFTQALTQGPNPTAASATAGNAFASLLLGYGTGTMLINSKNAATQSQYFGFYFQDDWKANARLTLNLGIRWDADVPRTERYNQMETFDPNVASPLAGPTGITGLRGGLRFVGLNGYPRNQYDPQWTDWAPRFGFAYQAFRNTVIRGGYGIFFAPSYRQAGATIGNQGFSSSTSYNGIPDNLHPTLAISNPFPTGLNPIVGSSQGLLTGIGTSFETPVYKDNHMPYTQNWDFDIQQQFRGGILIDAAYVGSHGVQLNSAGENEYNSNQLTPPALTAGNKLLQNVPNPFFGIITTGPLAAAQVPLSNLVAPFPQFLTLQTSYPTGGYSLYQAFQLKVEKRFGNGLSALLAFTGQKLIDNFSIISNVGNNTGGIQNIYDRNADRAISSNDISKHFSVGGVYNLPFGRGQKFGTNWNRAIDALLGGWSINAIATGQTGFPLSPTTQNTSNSNSNVLRPNNNGQSAALSGPVSARLNGYLNATVFSQPVPFTFGNSPRTLPDVRAMGIENLDFSLFKNFRIVESLSAQFRAEAFNLLDQVVFGTPNMTLSSGQFGVITAQSNSPRQLQFALKLLF